MPQCLIALGGNTGNVTDNFNRCLDELNSEAAVFVEQASSFLSTAAVGEVSGGKFLNAAAKLRTDLSPLELLDMLQEVETRHGRSRDVRWGPRTLDLDIIFYGDLICKQPRLSLPHPACWYRRFVLDPLVEIAAEQRHPLKDLTVEEVRQRLLKRPLRIAVAGGFSSPRSELLTRLQERFPDVELAQWVAETPSHAQLPAIIAWLGVGDDVSFWERLPLVARLDVTRLEGDPLEAMCAVVKSAHG